MTYRVLFIYPVTQPYSGQTAATQLAIRELESHGWDCASLDLPSIKRSGSRLFNLVRFGGRMLRDWWRILCAVRGGQQAICFNHSQSYAGFLRMGLPHLLLRRLFPRRFFVASLHGNLFATWQSRSRIMRIFLRILAASDRITVLGDTQRDKLIALGIAPEKLLVLPNTGDVDPMPTEAIALKHSTLRDDSSAPLVLLHLSLLIESKGFMEFLDASEWVARTQLDRPIEIVLCGPLVSTPFTSRQTGSEENAARIEEKIAALNVLPGVSASWLPGAVGPDKKRLFERAHIFIFPSRYPVEAQPLVLLEAMAAGCCLVTSDQGEIPSTIGADSGVYLEDVSPRNLAAVIKNYACDHEARCAAALNGRARVENKFSKDVYRQRWEELLTLGWKLDPPR